VRLITPIVRVTAAAVAVSVTLTACVTAVHDDFLVNAADHCDPDRVRALLDEGGDPNKVEDTSGSSAVSVAARGSGAARDGTGCLETLKVLIDAGGRFERIRSGASVLEMTAVGQGDPDVVYWLVEQGADPCATLHDSVEDAYGVVTLAELARQEGQPAVADAIETVTASCP